MRAFETAQIPVSFGDFGKKRVRTQFAALPYRVRRGKPEVLLVTSRQRKRWIIPKGWPTEGLTPAESAEQEAWEEGGVRGKVFDVCVGIYGYTKILNGKRDLPCMVAVFPLRVDHVDNDFPERKERKRDWVSLKKAVKKLDEPELKQILSRFDPAWLLRA